MKRIALACSVMGLAVLTSCAPSPEEQAAMAAAQRAQDQDRCAGFGFAPGTDAFAHCMMNIASQRDAQAAADRRAATAQQAADQRARAAQQAAKDAADRDAWDRRTGQGIYSYTPPSPEAVPSPPSASSNPVDAVRDSISRDMNNIENAGTLSP